MAESPAALRLFVALNSPAEFKTGLARIQTAFRAALPDAAIRWTPPDQFHLTLRFLGDVPSSQLPRLTEALQQACSGFSHLHLTAGHVGFFPNSRAPRVLWVGVVEAHGQLLPLQAAIQNASQTFTLAPAEDRFSPHITLARAKRLSRAEIQAFADLAATFDKKTIGDWTVTALELMRSELSSTGARHSVLAALPLRVPATQPPAAMGGPG